MRTFSSIEQIEEATRDGSFEENHYLEAKTILKTRSSTDKDELARDLAQFAFDGGTVVFGVSEDKSRSEGRFAVKTCASSSSRSRWSGASLRSRCECASCAAMTPRGRGALSWKCLRRRGFRTWWQASTPPEATPLDGI